MVELALIPQWFAAVENFTSANLDTTVVASDIMIPEQKDVTSITQLSKNLLASARLLCLNLRRQIIK